MKNRKVRIGKLLSVILFLALMLSPVYGVNNANAADVQPDTFKFGAILTLSGPMAAMGLLEKDGIEIAVEDINNNGGIMIQGKKRLIEPIYYDDEASPKKAMDATYSLINKYDVKAIVGLRMNEAIEAVQQITEKKKVLVLTTVASYPGVFLGKKYGVLVSDSGWTEAVDVVRLLTEDPAVLKKAGISPDVDTRYDFRNKKVAFLGRDEMYCRYADIAMKDSIEHFGKKQGLKYVGGTMYPIGTTDVTPYIQRMMAAKPDIINVGLYIYEDTLLLLRALREMGYDWGPNGNVLLTNGNDDFNWAHVVGPLYEEGFELKGNLSTGADMPLELAEKYPIRKTFIDKMLSKHNRQPGLMEDCGYDEVFILAKSAEKANTMTDSDAILQTMLRTSFDGVRWPDQKFVTPETVPELGMYINQMVQPHYVRIITDENKAKYVGITYTKEDYWGRGVSGKELLIK